MIKVVHCKKEPFDVYIGRSYNVGIEHFGNPWSHKPGAYAVDVPTREQAIDNYRKWLEQKNFFDVEPDRRLWILSRLPLLKDKTLGCWCSPLACHGDVIKELVENLK